MITSKQILDIFEQWVSSLSSNFKDEVSVDIFVNPTSFDIIDLRRVTTHYVRFIADSKDKKLYIWNGEAALHAQVAKHLGILPRIESIPDKTLIGVADIKGGKLVARYSDYLFQMLQDLKLHKAEISSNSYLRRKLDYFKTFEAEFKWVNSYLDTTELVKLVNRNLI